MTSSCGAESPSGARQSARSGFTPAQREMLLDSDPDDLTGGEGCGVELRTGAAYATARALERKGLGHINGPGGSFAGMYWSNAAGLRARYAIVRAEGLDGHAPGGPS